MSKTKYVNLESVLINKKIVRNENKNIIKKFKKAGINFTNSPFLIFEITVAQSSTPGIGFAKGVVI